MRVQICQEGPESTDVNGQFIEIGAIQWEEGKEYVISWNAQWDVMNVMGTATDIQRDENGVLTAEVNVDSLTADAKNVFADVGTTIFAIEVVAHKVGNVRHVTSCKLKALFFTLALPWKNPPLLEETDDQLP